MIPQVDGRRLSAEIEELARMSDAPYPAVTRVLFTPPDMRAREWMAALCRDAGLAVRFDAVGNMFARWEGTDPAAAPVATGSHTDAIPDAGRFDGVVGVLGGLEAIRALRRAGAAPRRPVELVVFTAEEPTRFGVGCVGSRVMAGDLRDDRLAALRDDAGLTLDEARIGAGYGGDISTARLTAGCYHAFVELHIEQGPLLEREGIPLGVVTAIAAPATLRVTLTGPGGHAGAVLMRDRNDPMGAAAEVMLAAEGAARGTGSDDTVATCGLVEVRPGAVNSIPREVRLTLDIRDVDGGRRDAVLERVRSAARDAAGLRGVGLVEEVLNADAPAACDPALVETAEAACRDAGAPHMRMVSRAYHDSLFMARLCPTVMLFIPCRGGVSHRPDEHAEPAHIAAGVDVLARTLARLAA